MKGQTSKMILARSDCIFDSCTTQCVSFLLYRKPSRAGRGDSDGEKSKRLSRAPTRPPLRVESAYDDIKETELSPESDGPYEKMQEREQLYVNFPITPYEEFHMTT